MIITPTPLGDIVREIEQNYSPFGLPTYIFLVATFHPLSLHHPHPPPPSPYSGWGGRENITINKPEKSGEGEDEGGGNMGGGCCVRAWFTGPYILHLYNHTQDIQYPVTMEWQGEAYTKQRELGLKENDGKLSSFFFNNLQEYNLESLSSQQPLVESIYCKSRYKIFNLVLKSSNILVFLLLLKWWKLMTAKFLLQICINDSLFLFQHFNNITTYKPNVLTYKYAVALFD